MGWLFLVRHATTAASESGRNLGQRDDAPLAPAGERLAQALAGTVRGELADLAAGPVRLVSSPAKRCLQTMAAVASALTARDDAGGRAPVIEVERGFIEIDYGEWEGLTAEECRVRDPALRDQWERDPFTTRCPGGESGADVAARSGPAFEDLTDWLRAEPARAAVVVAHNHVNRLHLCRLFGWPLADYRWRITQFPGAYSAIGHDERGVSVRCVNAVPRRPAQEGRAGVAPALLL